MTTSVSPVGDSYAGFSLRTTDQGKSVRTAGQYFEDQSLELK